WPGTNGGSRYARVSLVLLLAKRGVSRQPPDQQLLAVGEVSGDGRLGGGRVAGAERVDDGGVTAAVGVWAAGLRVGDAEDAGRDQQHPELWPQVAPGFLEQPVTAQAVDLVVEGEVELGALEQAAGLGGERV